MMAMDVDDVQTGIRPENIKLGNCLNFEMFGKVF